MSDQFVAEVRIFGCNFAPVGWALCDGSILSIAQNTALFSLLGTTYGGNGQSNFALPDLRGRYAMDAGNGPGLTPRVLGEMSGEENHTLITAEAPAHSHSVGCVVDAGADSGRPNGNLPSVSASTIYASTPADQTMSASMIGASGGSQQHNNMPPYTCVTFIIALNGIFPSRN